MIRPALALGIVLLVLPARAEWMLDGEEVPVARLDANLTRRLKADPADVATHVTLARVLSYAWAEKGEAIRVQMPADEADLPTFPPWRGVRPQVYGERPPDSKERRAYFMRSVHHFRRAIELDPKNAVAQLGLGWVIENGRGLAVDLGRPDGAERRTPMPAAERARYRGWIKQLGDDAYETRQSAARSLRENLERAFGELIDARARKDVEVRAAVGKLLRMRWDDFALEAYRRVLELRGKADLAEESFGDGADESIALEAGRGILRILERRKPTDGGSAVAKEMESVGAIVKKLNAKPKWVTPVVIAPRGTARLADLVDADKTVSFDLDGDGHVGRWPWLRPTAGLLVWDPQRTGRVDSGRRLFGSATWWMSWRHGYEPLAALDDDGDGRLTGRELAGLSVWFDRDGDAVSDDGEVVTVESLRIASIIVAARRDADGVLGNARGVVYRDGTTAPTWDWCPRRR